MKTIIAYPRDLSAPGAVDLWIEELILTQMREANLAGPAIADVMRSALRKMAAVHDREMRSMAVALANLTALRGYTPTPTPTNTQPTPQPQPGVSHDHTDPRAA